MLLTIPVHSATNYLALRLLFCSLLMTELVVALVGSAALVAGLAAFCTAVGPPGWGSLAFVALWLVVTGSIRRLRA